MRTVHEPEPIKLKLTNGSSAAGTRKDPARDAGPSYDEDGNPVNSPPAWDDIVYVPALHPVTHQAGFMITYPPGIEFSSQESSLPANVLMSLLRRQIHWAEQEGERLKRECTELERIHKNEWDKKEVLLGGVMEASLAHAESTTDGWFAGPEQREMMHRHVEPTCRRSWIGDTPWWRIDPPTQRKHEAADASRGQSEVPHEPAQAASSSPPPAARREEDAEPYDSLLAGVMAQYEAKQRERNGSSPGF